MDPRRRGRGASPAQTALPWTFTSRRSGALSPRPTTDGLRAVAGGAPLDALDTLDARGHIVLFNRPMDPLLINTVPPMEAHSTNAVEAPAPPPKRAPLGCWCVP